MLWWYEEFEYDRPTIVVVDSDVFQSDDVSFSDFQELGSVTPDRQADMKARLVYKAKLSLRQLDDYQLDGLR